MRARLLSGLAPALLGIILNSAVAAVGGEPVRVEFNRDVRPILSENCYFCHGPDSGTRKARLRLDERDSALKHGAIVAGNPDDSELIVRILSEDDDVMPPREAHKTLTASQKQILQDWIAQGAEYQAHWAYVAPARRPIPEVQRRDWVRNPIDAFLLAAMEARKIAPSPEASKTRLVRRLYQDLLGLPPTPEQVRAFEEDADPRAYEKLVDRLLESPHYGERMAVGWLDLARFTDTVGYHGDQNQRIFPYRDYVVSAFNSNKPFDVFVVEQLAGDLLPSPTPEQLVATGFNRLNMMTREGGAQPGEYLVKYAADRVRTVGLTFLGSTFGCAECHDHKYDPITQRDFYTLSAFFADVKQWGVYSDYAYTPNPDLKGWNNEFPFPPEILVESPYLQQRQERLIETLRTEAARETSPQTLALWLNRVREIVVQAQDGWLSLRPESVQGASEALPDGSLLLLGTAKLDPKPKAKAKAKTTAVEEPLRFQSAPGAGWVSRVRIELIPDPRHDGRIVREGAEDATVALTATVETKGEKGERPVKFHLADADFKTPRYVSGDDVRGVLSGWRSDKAQVGAAQTAVWCLESPLELTEGQTLKVEIKTSQAGRVRVSLSPFGVDASGKPLGDLDAASLAAVLATDADRSPAQNELLRALYHRSAGADAEGWPRIRDLCLQILECRDGRAYSLITQAAPPLETRVLPRGDFLNRDGEVVEPEVPRFLPHESVPTGRRLTRLDLARWITAEENPLTSRVFVNRLWKQVFGVGLSAVMEDVGGQGEWPVNPELLDWLAVDFRESGWDVKRLVKMLVTSAAYRQDSRVRPELKDLDPNNRWVTFLSPRRLEAEFVRDGALSVAGLLNRDVGGPSAKPYQPAGYYANIQFPDREYVNSVGDLQYRRGLYSHWQRTFMHPMLANFDAPSREECTPARNMANTPQQALTLLNDPSFVEAARELAVELLTDGGAVEDAARLDRLYQRSLSRTIASAERDSLAGYLAERRKFYHENPKQAEALLHVGQGSGLKGIDPAEAAAWTMTCRIVLNLHETITRY